MNKRDRLKELSYKMGKTSWKAAKKRFKKSGNWTADDAKLRKEEYKHLKNNRYTDE